MVSRYSQSLPRHSKGLTLVEVMIAMVLGLILLAALSNVFIGNMQTRAEIEKVGRQIENGRFAMQTLLDDISNAGFYAGATRGDGDDDGNDDAFEELDFCDLSAINSRMLLPPLATTTTTLDCTPDHKANTSIIIVRRFSSNAAGTDTVQHCGDDAEGALAPAATCVQIDSNGVARFDRGAMEAKLHDGETFAPVRIPVAHIYYVDVSNNLRRASIEWTDGNASFPDAPETLVDGIEMMSFSIVGQSAQLNILARSSTASPKLEVETKSYPAFQVGGAAYETSDNIRRQFYSAAINIYNPL